jgi:hypothetical protein
VLANEEDSGIRSIRRDELPGLVVCATSRSINTAGEERLKFLLNPEAEFVGLHLDVEEVVFLAETNSFVVHVYSRNGGNFGQYVTVF